MENLPLQRENLTQLTKPQETGTLKRKEATLKAIGAFISYHG
jgi:hypothetical protein